MHTINQLAELTEVVARQNREFEKRILELQIRRLTSKVESAERDALYWKRLYEHRTKLAA